MRFDAAGPGDACAGVLRVFGRDARFGQIAVLGSLLTWNITNLSLGASLLPSLVSVGAALAAQVVAVLFTGSARLDLRSPLITGLSLALLLRTDTLWLQGAAAALAIGSKAAIRLQGKHLFNPAALAILVMLWSGHGWVSPGQWGQSAILVAAMAGFGTLVLRRAERLDVALAFGATYAGLLLLRALWLGDPATIPLHQLESGSLVLFTCFMITDPRTTPDARSARIGFAVAIAALAHWLIFVQQVPFGLYLSLVVVSLMVPLLDRLFPADRFVWHPVREISA